MLKQMGYGLWLFSATAMAQTVSNDAEPLLRLFTTPLERQQIERALFAPPPPPPIEEVDSTIEDEPMMPLEIYYQGFIQRPYKPPLLLINGMFIEHNFYGHGFMVQTDQLRGQTVPVTLYDSNEVVFLIPGQRINTQALLEEELILDNYEQVAH